MKPLTESAKEVVKEVVKAAIELISNPAKWTTGTCARDEVNFSVPSNTKDACKWCAYGALDKIAYDKDLGLQMAFDISDLFYEKFEESIGLVNDEQGREVIIDKLLELSNSLSKKS
jgi:hypothetical protein